MKSLLNRDNIKHIKLPNNKFRLTKRDLVGEIKGFPVGVVVRMLEEQEMQGNEPDVEVFQKSCSTGSSTGGFDWEKSKDKYTFWEDIICYNSFDRFYKKYPEYKKYDI